MKKELIFTDMFGNQIKCNNGNFSVNGKFEIPVTMEVGNNHYSTDNITVKEYHQDLIKKQKAYSI